MLTANMAVLLAAQGKRVGVIDTNLQSSSQQLLFGMPFDDIQYTFNNYLLGQCDGAQIVYDITPYRTIAPSGQVFLIPARKDAENLHRVLGEGYVIELITDGITAIAQQFMLDVLLVDTPALMSDETLLSVLSLAIADQTVILLQLDQQNYQGTGVMVDVVRTLEVPRITLVANQVSALYEPDAVKEQIEDVYKCPVSAVLPYVEEIAVLGITDIFALHSPNHIMTQMLDYLATILVSEVSDTA